mmetsp:Transcript_21056/g.45649  ORF Transcript_21056/g.45649 Transcript_21056/m.45649 type:complete len:1184 (+) Transcript_21056:404-3955(+)|eukprot:CAMPEP_0172317090 /NCGR_PEP_ID=MMETSP1058-20130122/30530_1 /TAXON_ID=83371 /ORGANISM="Detonula confervacea, Strain CCMP 353" /LENGTH=1183 /DNA_ID=CAMNT_0013031559 /DNA_START=335 /DNA_END=3886 /DNA_ORIENTATION=+
MVGSKRSTRLAARKSKPKYKESGSDEGANSHESKNTESDEGFSRGEGSDDASESTPNESSLPSAETKAASNRRRGKMDRQQNRSLETSKSSDKRVTNKANNPKPPSKMKTIASYFKRAEKTEPSLPAADDDGGNDHVEDDTACQVQKETIIAKRSKRLRSTIEESKESKIPKLSAADNGKLPSSDDIPSESDDILSESTVDETNEEGGGPPLQILNITGKSEGGVDVPTTFRKVHVDEGGREREADPKCNDSHAHDIHSGEDTLRIDAEPRTTTDEPKGNMPIAVDSNDSTHEQEIKNPALASSSGETSKDDNGAKAKDLTESDTARTKIDILNESKTPNDPDSKARVSESSENSPVKGGSDHTSDDSPMQIDGQEKENPGDRVLVASANDVDEPQKTPEASMLKVPVVPSSPPNHEIQTLSARGGSPTSLEVKREDPGGHPNSNACELNCAIDSKQTDQSSSAQSIEDKDAKKDNGGNAENSSHVSGETLSATAGSDKMTRRNVSNEIALHHLSSQTSVEKECLSSSEIHVRDTHVSSEQRTDNTVSMSIQYPKTTQTRQAPSVGQLKMALYLEASKAHRGNGAERIFANYWETLEKYISLGTHDGAIQRVRSDLSASCAGIEATLRGFLKTRKMKRLHNKLILAVMTESIRTDIPSRCSSKIPQQWQTKTVQSAPDQPNEKDVLVKVDCRDRKSDLRKWNADFGPQSGTWSICGDEIALTKTDPGNYIHPEMVGSIHKGDPIEEAVLPSARLPGALEIEPLVRKHIANSGLTASENAIWMLVVAVREHSSSLIKKVIANDKDFDHGYAPQLPNHFQTSLACQHLSPENSGGINGGKSTQDDVHVRSGGEGKKRGKRVIDSTSLSHALAEKPSVASRLMSMYSAVTLENGRGFSSHPDLDNVNCIINASIQRAATRSQKSSTGGQNLLPRVLHSTPAFPARINVNSSSHSDENIAKAQPPATHLFSTTSLPLNKPQLAAQRIDQSIPPPLPRSQPALLSMSSQNIQPLHSAQLMNHSDHLKGNNTTDQHTLPISRAVIPNSEPLTKPGFPGITNNVHTKSATSQNIPKKPEPPTTSSPPHRALKRGSKNLAAMMTRPIPQPRPASDKGNTTSDEKNANGTSLGNAAAKDETGENKDGARGKKDEAKESKPPAKGPSRPTSRGFGVKNLAAMRARSSFSDSGK